jgi:hypothetical protein
MTHEEYLERLRTTGENLRKDPEKLVAFLKSLGLLKKRRILQGEEREQVLTMLRLMGPGEESNNQHVWTESWRIGNVEYNYHTGSGINELEEVIDDE